MPRKSILAPVLVALALCLLPTPAARSAGIAAPEGARTAAPKAKVDETHAAESAPAQPHEEAAHDEGSGGHARPNILEPQLPLAFWTLVVFLVLLFVLWKFAWGPLSKALHDREHHFQHSLEEAERARAEAEKLLALHREQMDRAQQQAQAILDEARRDARENSDQIQRTAQAEADATRKRALNDIETARDQALTEIWSKTADLAVGIAGKLLQKELGPDDHRRLIDLATSELPATAKNGHRGPGA